MVDGLSRTKAFLRITFPLLAPGLVASGVYAFLQAWNEFTVALVVMTEEQSRTLPLWLRGFVQASATRETDWGQVMAASTLVATSTVQPVRRSSVVTTSATTSESSTTRAREGRRVGPGSVACQAAGDDPISATCSPLVSLSSMTAQ